MANELYNNCPLKFEMSIALHFNREIKVENEDGDYLSPGGYEMVMASKNIAFDFEDYEGYVDKEKKNLVTFHMSNPDYETYPDLKTVTSDMLKNVTDIVELYVCAEAMNGNDPMVEAVRQIVFFVHDAGEKIEVPQEVLDKYNKCLAKNQRKGF